MQPAKVMACVNVEKQYSKASQTISFKRNFIIPILLTKITATQYQASQTISFKRNVIIPILLTKITATQYQAALNSHRVRGLYFLAVFLLRLQYNIIAVLSFTIRIIFTQ